MPTICLIHGGWHGSWCWDLLRPHLSGAAQIVAVDLPIEDDVGVGSYADVVISALDGVDEPVILVGHSMGGLVVPVVAERRPVSQAVYLCASVPEVGQSPLQQVAADPEQVGSGMAQILASAELVYGGAIPLDTDEALSVFYHDCTPGVAQWAAAELRPQGCRVMLDTSPLGTWPSVRSHYILCTDDRALQPAWSRKVGAPRVGASVSELPGGHSPFLSRPEALAETLLNLVSVG